MKWPNWAVFGCLEKFFLHFLFWAKKGSEITLCIKGTVDTTRIKPSPFKRRGFSTYLRNHLSNKKVFYQYLHRRLKSFQLKQEYFKLIHKIIWYWPKPGFSSKKLHSWKNPSFWKNQKCFFMDSSFNALYPLFTFCQKSR